MIAITNYGEAAFAWPRLPALSVAFISAHVGSSGGCIFAHVARGSASLAEICQAACMRLCMEAC